jgi:hypothetical protein
MCSQGGQALKIDIVGAQDRRDATCAAFVCVVIYEPYCREQSLSQLVTNKTMIFTGPKLFRQDTAFGR